MTDEKIMIKEYEIRDNIVVTPDNIEEIINKYEISSIYFRGERMVQGYCFISTDLEHPFVLDVSGNDATLYVNQEWYEGHKEEAKQLLERIMKDNKSSSLEILSEGLIETELLQVLKENSSLKNLELGLSYQLTLEDYQILRDSSIEQVKTAGVVDELQDIFEPFIGYNWRKKLIDYYSYEKLITCKSVTVSSEEELKYLYLLPPTCVVKVSADSFELLTKLLETDYSGKIVVDIKDKFAFNAYLKEHPIMDKKVDVHVDLETVPLDVYIRLEAVLDDMVKGLEDFSPLEKYIYIYNMVKQYKDYKENEEDRMAARNLYKILENEYMVCVGFSRMLVDLCRRVGIPAEEFSTKVDTSYDKYDRGKEPLEIEKSSMGEGHARTHVYLKDPKYNIDGYYLADATWDNDLEHDSYSYALLTVEERLAAKRFLISNYRDGEEFFDAQSIEIFYAKVNRKLDMMALERNKRQKGKNLPNSVLKNMVVQDTIRDMVSVINMILEFLDKINPSYVADFRNNYPCLKNPISAKKADLEEAITILGNHIVDMNNKQIGGADLFRAIKEIYARKYGYQGQELSEKLSQTIIYNRDSHAKRFPTRTLEYQDGHTEIYKDVPNKFDLPLPIVPTIELQEEVVSEEHKVR